MYPTFPTPIASRQPTFNSQPSARSYLQVALTPPPPQKTCKTLKPLSLSRTCFRCLASDHLVDECRDPVRCRRCHGYGHRSSSCKMPLSRLFHASMRRLATIRMPATSHSIRAVPFSPRFAPPASSSPPSPPPSSPEVATILPPPSTAPASPPPVLPPTTAYDPAFMITSSFRWAGRGGPQHSVDAPFSATDALPQQVRHWGKACGSPRLRVLRLVAGTSLATATPATASPPGLAARAAVR